MDWGPGRFCVSGTVEFTERFIGYEPKSLQKGFQQNLSSDMQRRRDGNAASGGVAVAAQERAADALAVDGGSAGHLRSALTVEGEAAGAAGTSGASESAAGVARGEGHGDTVCS